MAQSKRYSITTRGQSGIIYCLSRASVMTWTAKLQSRWLFGLPYMPAYRVKKTR